MPSPHPSPTSLPALALLLLGATACFEEPVYRLLWSRTAGEESPREASP